MKSMKRCLHRASASPGGCSAASATALRAGVYLPPKDGDDQAGALREVAVHRAEPNAGLLGDLPDSRIDSIACEHRHRGMQEGFGVALRVSALLRGLRRRVIGGTTFRL
jgi:hypothetical protein